MARPGHLLDTTGTAMIEIQNLSKHFGPIRAVDDVSFAVERGEVLGFLGPNGAGKSTTMKMLTGFLPPSSGRASVCGIDVAERPIEAKAHLGYLPEGAPAYPDMTPAAFLAFTAEVRGISRADARRKIAEVVERVHLEGVMQQPIETLSKGFKRRVGLAQAILHDPPVLVLDEPTDGLDPNQKHEVRDLIRAMAPDKAIVLSTHILEEVNAVCSRAIIINRGRIVADGTPEELRARSRWHNAVHLCLAEEPDGAAEILADVAGVQEVDVNGAVGAGSEYVLFPADGQPIAHAVGRLARDRGWEVDELRVEQGRLDEVFRNVTTTDVEAGR